jgi:hypothetical protein
MNRQFSLNIEIEEDVAFVTSIVNGRETFQWFGLPSAVNDGVSMVIKSVLGKEGV